jgi:hypothetical protein
MRDDFQAVIDFANALRTRLEGIPDSEVRRIAALACVEEINHTSSTFVLEPFIEADGKLAVKVLYRMLN